jgi:GDP-L-fucose synthase
MKVLIAGGTGLVGSSLVRLFSSQGFEIFSANRSNLDLLNRNLTLNFICNFKPDLIVDAAAKVGGIGANNTYPVEFMLNNINIQNNLMEAAHAADVPKFIFLGSSCIYPRSCPQPIKEEYLLTGHLEKTNSAYAIAKIAGIELINSYRKQFGKKWISIMPTNLYGPNDNFQYPGSHVVPALIRRFVEATYLNKSTETLWGSGTPLREFLYVDDLSEAILTLIRSDTNVDLFNIGSGTEISIMELSYLIAEETGFRGTILWDESQPDGTPRKILDSSKIKQLGWKPKTPLNFGVRQTVIWFKEALKYGNARV